MTEERINAEDAPRIAERVKFWEEQDRINQELIPRVIRQQELLTGHISDHENLPLIAGNAINEALAEAREEQGQQLAAARAEREEQGRQHEAELAVVQGEREEQNRRHEAELAAVKAEREEQDRQHEAELAAAKAERGEQDRRHEAELAAAKTEREEQDRQYQTSLAALQGQTVKVRNLVIGVSFGAAVISTVAIVVAIIIYVGGTA